MNSLLDELNAGVDDEDMVAALRKMTVLVQKEQDLPAGMHARARMYAHVRTLDKPIQPPTSMRPAVDETALARATRRDATELATTQRAERPLPIAIRCVRLHTNAPLPAPHSLHPPRLPTPTLTPRFLHCFQA